ncbi:MAG: asparagine synthase (glutamine-hydrolyzing) [Steroidobacteraceae bacterium]|jgi:asparagine synthase (glutamine-hydrolysing)|nr:asparagine synthase (glutamine-hydrolyzing) [Steroidobacteraceae bacterium]
MCGIAGIVNHVDRVVDGSIERMIDHIHYRGPDGAGAIAFEQDGVALGHRRLSILDVSEAGRQPMSSADGRFWIVYNGEIYNYLEIRQVLEGLGHEFRTGTDTEVLLQAYIRWGAACLDRVMGMYAFAIWDRQEHELFAARDRLGIKPFYYVSTGAGLVFASEIKAILQVLPSPGVDVPLIDAYMEFGYVPGEHTLHRGVKRLLPGYWLKWKDGRLSVQAYWELDFNPDGEPDFHLAVDELRSRLEESMALHLRSDVPLGVFLSGGLDSSAVVAMLSPAVTQGLNTFSVAYDFGPQYDETSYAREVAGKFGAHHHEIYIGPKQFREFVPGFAWHMDEPVTEAAAISLYYVSRLARQHVTVCLSGEGSDELFGGYDFYVYNLAMDAIRGKLGGRVLSRMADLTGRSTRLAKASKYLRLASLPLPDRYRGISSYGSDAQAWLYAAELKTRIARDDGSSWRQFVAGLFERTERWNPLSRMLYFDTKTWLVDDLLIKADRMSMACSIELRVPFLDHRLVEFAAKLPAQFKIAGRKTKRILKEALADRLPERIVNRKKMGFPTPLEMMFRGELLDYARDTLLSSTAVDRGYFERAAIERMIEQHRTGRAAHHNRIWQLLVLEEWHRAFGY